MSISLISKSLAAAASSRAFSTCGRRSELLWTKDLYMHMKLDSIRPEYRGTCFCKTQLKNAVLLRMDRSIEKIALCPKKAFLLPHLTPRLQFTEFPKYSTHEEIIRALFALEKDLSLTLPKSVLVWAAAVEGKLTGDDCLFYMKEIIDNPNPLTEKVEQEKERIHRRILLEFVWDRNKALSELERDPVNNTAGPHLLRFAYEDEIIDLNEMKLYERLSKIPHPSESEKRELENINLKVIYFMNPNSM